MQHGDPFYSSERIPRLSCQDSLAWELMAQERPVILTDTKLCSSALRWNLEYLEEHIGNGEHVVFASDSNIFKYYDEQKIKFCPEFQKPTQKLEMTFKDFASRFQNWKPGEKRLYLQQSLSSSVGPVVAADFVAFNWLWLKNLMRLVQWGPLTSNLLLIAMPGSVTPVHYDEQQNLFCQLVGHKRVVLFSPDHYNRLYPHPVYHPHDRQSQVDLSNPNFSLYPGLRGISGHEAVVGPGDVLYIPIYWWHEVCSLPAHPYTVSLNFWYKAAPTENVSYPLSPRQEVVIMRNIEKMIVDVFKEPSQVDHFFQSLTLGRYTVLGATVPARLSSSVHSCSAGHFSTSRTMPEPSRVCGHPQTQDIIGECGVTRTLAHTSGERDVARTHGDNSRACGFARIGDTGTSLVDAKNMGDTRKACEVSHQESPRTDISEAETDRRKDHKANSTRGNVSKDADLAGAAELFASENGQCSSAVVPRMPETENVSSSCSCCSSYTSSPSYCDSSYSSQST